MSTYQSKPAVWGADTTLTVQSSTAPGGANMVSKTATMLDMKLHRRVGDLCNPIHAIFRRSNFRNITDDEYDALKNTLRLVTRFLTTRELAGFPHAILVAPYKHVKHPEDEKLDEWSFQSKRSRLMAEDPGKEPKDLKLTARDMAEYNLCLSQLADMIYFVADEKEHHNCGYCCGKLHDKPQNTHLERGSVVNFSRKDIEVLVAHRGNAADDLNLLQDTFSTAKILLHELMHAFAFARLGHLDNIPFEDGKVVETGYELEDHIWEGVISPCDLKSDAFHTDLTIRDWPSASTTRYYQHKAWPIEIYEEPSAVEIYWFMIPVVGDSFTRIFTTKFWETTIPEEGLKALRPKRVRGYLAKVSAEGVARLLDLSCEDDASYSHIIPGGYILNEDGLVELNLPDDQDP